MQLCKFYENRARDTPLRVVSIPHFDQISVKISVLGLLCPNRCTDWGEIWHGRGDHRGGDPSSMPNFTPIGATCRPCGSKKPQNRSTGFYFNRGKGVNRGSGTKTPCIGVQEQSPWSGGQGWSPSEAESFSVVRYPKEMKKKSTIIFLFYGLFSIQQNVWSCVYYTTMLWWRVILHV